METTYEYLNDSVKWVLIVKVDDGEIKKRYMETIYNDMQAKYPKKQPTICWDPAHLEYPVRKFPGTGVSSATTGHDWLGVPEVLKDLKDPLSCIKGYYQDYNVERNLMQSQSTQDFGHKQPETKRHYKHNSCVDNLYIYPPSRRLSDRPPQCRVHGTTEMKSSYTEPRTPARLVTGNKQYMHPACFSLDPPEMEPSFHKDLEPLETTHDGFEKYLDPYLTTSRLHHRPNTADQLSKESNAPARNIVTYYTFSDTPWVRTPKAKPEFWRLPLPSKQKSVYDREKFKEDFREIRTHNKLTWVPGSFRTEVRDNTTSFMTKPRIYNHEENVQSMYQRALSALPSNIDESQTSILQGYTTENSTVGSRKPLSATFDQHKEKNKRLSRRENKV